MNDTSYLLPLLGNKIYDFKNQCIIDNYGLFSVSCPVTYDPNAKSELFDKFLDAFTLERQDLKDCIQEFFGCALTGDLWIKKYIHFYGNGDNGKSVLIDLFRAILGGFSSRASIDHFDFVKDCRGYIFNEAEETYRSVSAVIKKLLSRDTIFCKDYNDSVVNHGYPILVSNGNIDWDKSMLINVISIPCLYNANKSYKDPFLFDKLSQPETLSAILNWMIEGELRARTRGSITLPNY